MKIGPTRPPPPWSREHEDALPLLPELLYPRNQDDGVVHHHTGQIQDAHQ